MNDTFKLKLVKDDDDNRAMARSTAAVATRIDKFLSTLRYEIDSYKSIDGSRLIFTTTTRVGDSGKETPVDVVFHLTVIPDAVISIVWSIYARNHGEDDGKVYQSGIMETIDIIKGDDIKIKLQVIQIAPIVFGMLNLFNEDLDGEIEIKVVSEINTQEHAEDPEENEDATRKEIKFGGTKTEIPYLVSYIIDNVKDKHSVDVRLTVKLNMEPDLLEYRLNVEQDPKDTSQLKCYYKDAVGHAVSQSATRDGCSGLLQEILNTMIHTSKFACMPGESSTFTCYELID